MSLQRDTSVQNLTETWLRVVMPLAALSLFIGGLLHAGVALGPLDEPVIIPATIVEVACGLALAVASFAVYAGKPWRLDASIAAHGIALAGVVIGVIAQTVDPEDRTAENTIYHVTLIVFLVAGLALLLWGRRAGETSSERGRYSRQPR